MFGNLLRINLHQSQDEAAKLGDPVRDWEWDMASNTVNAYADPASLKVVFPAAMFQPPFFDAAGDKASNYGAIGATIAHELSHHFDETGADYDASGSVARWWNQGDTDSYHALANRLVAQYDGYEPLPSAKVSGKLTMGENAGDLAGLTLAYDAWQLSLGGKEPAVIGGVGGEQRFFLGWAAIWRRNISEASLRSRLATDPHAPSEQRAAIARNMDSWYRAFDISPGAALYLAPEDRVRIW